MHFSDILHHTTLLLCLAARPSGPVLPRSAGGCSPALWALRAHTRRARRASNSSLACQADDGQAGSNEAAAGGGGGGGPPAAGGDSLLQQIYQVVQKINQVDQKVDKIDQKLDKLSTQQVGKRGWGCALRLAGVRHAG